MIVPLPSLILGLAACPSYPPFSAGSRERLQVPTFHNSTYLNPQVSLTRNLRVRQQIFGNNYTSPRRLVIN